MAPQHVNPLQAAENAILAELKKRLNGNLGTDYDQFVAALPTDEITGKAFNNLRWRQQVRVWRPKVGAAKVIGFNPEYNSRPALPSLASF